MSAARSSHRPRHYRLFACVTLVISLALSLFLGEWLLRVFVPLRMPNMFDWPKGYFEHSTIVGYEQSLNFPPTPMMHWDGTSRNLVYSNSLGMRDVEPPRAWRKHTSILVLGCSMTEGMGIVSIHQPWPRQLEWALNSDPTRAATPVTVMNGGVAGYNTFQQVRHGIELHRRLGRGEDIWLMAYLGGPVGMWGRNLFGAAGQYRMHWNSLWDAEYLAQFLQGRPASSRWLLDHVYLWRWTCLVTTDFTLGDPLTARPFGQDYAAATTAALEGFQTAARQAGATPMLAYIPALRELEEIATGGEDWVRPRVGEIARHLGIPFLDPTPQLAAVARRDAQSASVAETWSISVEDLHYNARANAIYGQTLAVLLRDFLDYSSAAARAAEQ